jgi:hypothetical protein
MRVDIRTGGDGVACWNEQAIRAYAAEVDQREERLTSANPDLVILPGQVKCYGCEVMEYDYGTRCTATMTKPRFAVEGEIQPRAEDAAGSLLEIPGFVTKIETPATATSVDHTAAAAAASTPPARSGLRRLIGR